MTLPDGPRQVLAALLAAAVFLAMYFGTGLVWFAALPLAALAYGAFLLLIPRRKPLSEVVLSDRVTAADIAAGQAALDEALRRLAKAEAAADSELQADLAGLAADLRSIRTQIGDDPADFRIARRFIVTFLPKLVENIESYTALAAVATGSARDRLPRLREGIRAYRPAVTRIAQAGLENNFRALEAEIDALGFQLRRG
jgi:5-bromo-4-chloroindolyl phosphate hydrolysis protein